MGKGNLGGERVKEHGVADFGFGGLGFWVEGLGFGAV